MVDILLSTYNGEKYLSSQLDSLLSQTFKDYRIIVRDDGSSDDTANIIRSYKEKNPNKFILLNNNNQNLGSTNSFFELLKNSTSDLIMFCDQDDVWNKDKVEKTVSFYEKNCKDRNRPTLVHSAVSVVNENLSLIAKETENFNQKKCGMERSLASQVFNNDVTGCTVLVNSAMRDVLKPIDFQSHKVIQHDWLMALIAYVNNAKFFLPEKTLLYRQHKNNVIGTKKLSILQKILLKIKKGIQYPYYKQVETLLLITKPIKYKNEKLLQEFSNLKTKNKFLRILWHIKNKFFRNGNICYKFYQLIAC